MPLLVDGGDGDDVVRIQSVFEETFFQGGEEEGSSGGTDGDVLHLNVNATTSAPLTPRRSLLTSSSHVDSGHRLDKRGPAISLQDTTGGTFTLTFDGNTTPPLTWDTPPRRDP